jgi:hypothetical protein
MMVKYIYWAGVAACIALAVSCFLPWAYYADIRQHFTGFYSFHNEYGKPGKFLLFFSGLILMGMFLQRPWAKRVNLFLSALLLGYAIKSYILFGSCYNNYCPEKEAGLYIMLFSSMVMLVASVFPRLSIRKGD